ncbi:MAG: Uma2 family endonuclease [Gemmataceae bacterium]|nr:Uma2 family endonuclease [Gemmataceae bacterium]
MATANLPARNSLLLHDVDWRMYTRLLRTFRQRPSVRLTYDRGVLEIMSPLAEHEGPAYLLGRFVDVLTEELNLPVKAGRSTTFRKRRKRRGLEPDNSYWIANEAQVRGKDETDLRVDPPPDLAIEVDVTHSSLDRMGIYAKLGVAEVWRLADGQLTFHLLQPKGDYLPGSSCSFPGLNASDLLPFLDLRKQTDETSLVRQFRVWVRQRIADGWK